MKLGVMNHPAKDVYEEIKWIGQNNFDFVDLTLEPPKSLPSTVKTDKLSRLLHEYDLEVVGHTCPFLAVSSPFPSLRRASLAELGLCLEVFAQLRVSTMTVHLDHRISCFQGKTDVIQNNIEVLRDLIEKGKKLGVEVLVEHFAGIFSRTEGISQIFKALPEIGFTLDAGHANLFTSHNRTKEFLSNYSEKLKHVHFSDNKGGVDDLHLPIGVGNISWSTVISLLKKYKYDGRITLEIFSEDRQYLLMSREKVQALWEEAVNNIEQG